LAGQIEAGYRFQLPDTAGLPGSAGLTPYAALQVQSFHTPDYSETAASGSQAFALSYDARTSTSAYTELGVRADRSFLLESDTIVTLRAGIAWGHVESSDEIVNVAFQSLPDSGFTIQGAEIGEDSLRLSAGAEIKLVGGFGVAATFDTALAGNSQTYAGRGQISYSW
jgi:outer membrane autotransporter protein